MRFVTRGSAERCFSRKNIQRAVRQGTADGPPRIRGRSAPAVFRWILAARLIMSYKGISLVDHIHLGAYKMLELDIYALVVCYKMFEWIKCLVIKIELN